MLRRDNKFTAHPGSDSESDTDSVEEVQITKYFQKGLLHGIQQAKAEQSAHTGIKRQRGYYHLKDCRHALPEERPKAYTGRHYDVEINTNLQRATHRLTKHFIDNEVNREQARRIYFQDKIQKDAKTVLSPLNKEFKFNVHTSTEKELAEMHASKKKQELIKDDVQIELMRRHNTKVMKEEMEKERQRQLQLFKAMKTDAERSASVEDLVEALTEINQKREIVHRDILEGFAKYQEEEEDMEVEYQKAMHEVMDEALTGLVLKFARPEHRHMAEEEQQRRIEEMANASRDGKMQVALGKFDNVMEDLMQAFSRVQKEEEEIESELKHETEKKKEELLYELRRNFAKKYAQRVCAQEKLRRIREAEEMLHHKPNPEIERMKKEMVRIQRQMILQRFGGKWINLHRASKSKAETTEPETEYDRKIRQIRTALRRETCVKKED